MPRQSNSLTGQTSLLTAFILEQQYQRPYGQFTRMTHGSMDGVLGGVFYVADEMVFLSKYATDVHNKVPMFITEIKSDPVFPFFMDLDFQFHLPVRELTDVQRLVILRIILRTIRKFYPPETPSKVFNLFVCDLSAWVAEKTEPPSESLFVPTMSLDDLGCHEDKKDTNEYGDLSQQADAELFVKGGINQNTRTTISKDGNLHLYMPLLRVDTYMWLMLTQACENKLGLIIPHIKEIANVSQDIVDSSVINSSLRLVGSHKSQKCKACRGKGCPTCYYVGKVDLGRVYGLREILGESPDGKFRRQPDVFQKVSKRFVNVVKFCSIRVAAGTKVTPGFTPFGGRPQVSQALVKNVDVRRRAITDANGTARRKFQRLERGETTRVFFGSDQEKRSLNKKGLQISLDSPIGVILRNKIHGIHSNYSKLLINHIGRNLKRNKYTIFVRGDNSTFCQNLLGSGFHNGRSVFFQATIKGIVQRCSCKCVKTKNRRNGKCSDFISHEHPFTDREKGHLFPHQFNEIHRGASALVLREASLDPRSKIIGSCASDLLRQAYFKGYVAPKLAEQEEVEQEKTLRNDDGEEEEGVVNVQVKTTKTTKTAKPRRTEKSRRTAKPNMTAKPKTTKTAKPRRTEKSRRTAKPNMTAKPKTTN